MTAIHAGACGWSSTILADLQLGGNGDGTRAHGAPLHADIPHWVDAALLLTRQHHPDATLPTARALHIASAQHRIRTFATGLQTSPWFQRAQASDHIFIAFTSSSYKEYTTPLFEPLKKAWMGIHERNPRWTQGHPLDRVILLPYAAHAEVVARTVNLTMAEFMRPEPSTYGFFYGATIRKHAIQWSVCFRDRAALLATSPQALPKTLIVLNRNLVPHHHDTTLPLTAPTFDQALLHSEYCLFTCGDTPTSRRLFDILASGCIPIVLGTRLFDTTQHGRVRSQDELRARWGWKPAQIDGMHHLPFVWAVPYLPSHPDTVVAAIWDEDAYYTDPAEVARTWSQGGWWNAPPTEPDALRARIYLARQVLLYGTGNPMEVSEDGSTGSSPPTFFRLADAFLTEILHRHRHNNAFPDCMYAPPCQPDLTPDMVHAANVQVWEARAEPVRHPLVDIAPWTPS